MACGSRPLCHGAGEYSNFSIGKWWIWCLKFVTVIVLGYTTISIVLGLDANGAVQKGIEQGMKVGPASDAGAPSRLPLVILADSFNRVFFLSEGYTIGLGEQLAATVAKL